MTCVAQALEWSKRSFAENQNPDVYGYLCKHPAQTWAKQMKRSTGNPKAGIAPLLTAEASRKSYQATIG
jgi:hypothetical protein